MRLRDRVVTSTSAVPTSALVVLLVASCGGGPPPEPPVPPEAVGPDCPLPLVFSPDRPRPRRIRIENGLGVPVTVFIDRCFWHTALAEVPPGKARQPRLPDELIPYGDGLLRFHVFDGEAREYVGTYMLPVETRPVLRLELEPERAADADTLPGYSLSPGEERKATERTLVTNAERGYTSIWGVGGGGVLTWACGGGEVWISVAVGRKLRRDRPVRVRYRFDEGGWSEPAEWDVVASLTDAVVAPRERIREFTDGAVTSETVTVQVHNRRGEFRFPTTFAFETEGLASGLETLPCLERGG